MGVDEGQGALLYLHFLSEKEDMYEGMVVEPNRCR